MAAGTDLPVTPADGNMRADLVPAIADLSAPKITELNAVTAVAISCYLTADGLGITLEQASIPVELFCSTTTRSEPGRKTPALTLTGVDNTNTDVELTDNEMADALVEGSEHFLVLRTGVPFDTAYTVGQKVTIVKFKTGVKQFIAPEANSFIRSTWATFVSAYETNVTTVTGP